MNIPLLLEKIAYRISPREGVKQRMQASRSGTLDKMIALNERRKILYTVIPKAANSTIKRIIWSDFEAVKTMTSLNREHPTTAISELTDKRIEAILHDPEWLKFSFVRNPYTRVVSAYQDKILNPSVRHRQGFLKKIQWDNNDLPTFDQFIEILSRQDPRQMDWHWRPQHLLLMLDVIDYQLIGKIENFSADFKPVLDRFTLDREEAEQLLNLKLNTTKASAGAEIKKKEPISDETARLIQQIYKEDFVRFDYDMNFYTSFS